MEPASIHYAPYQSAIGRRILTGVIRVHIKTDCSTYYQGCRLLSMKIGTEKLFKLVQYGFAC